MLLPMSFPRVRCVWLPSVLLVIPWNPPVRRKWSPLRPFPSSPGMGNRHVAINRNNNVWGAGRVPPARSVPTGFSGPPPRAFLRRNYGGIVHPGSWLGPSRRPFPSQQPFRQPEAGPVAGTPPPPAERRMPHGSRRPRGPLGPRNDPWRR